MDRIAAARGAIVCFRFDLVELRRCCTFATAISSDNYYYYWRNLWESEGTGDRCASWLEEIRSAIQSRVPPPTEEDWDLDPVVAGKVLAKKKNWSAPGPDRLANFW